MLFCHRYANAPLLGWLVITSGVHPERGVAAFALCLPVWKGKNRPRVGSCLPWRMIITSTFNVAASGAPGSVLTRSTEPRAPEARRGCRFGLQHDSPGDLSHYFFSCLVQLANQRHSRSKDFYLEEYTGSVLILRGSTASHWAQSLQCKGRHKCSFEYDGKQVYLSKRQKVSLNSGSEWPEASQRTKALDRRDVSLSREVIQ